MRASLPHLDRELTAILDPRRLLRWVYLGRLSLASAIFIAAVIVWPRADTDTGKLLVASLAFAVTAMVTVGSFAYSEIYRRRLTPTFRYLQSIYDLLLVTAVVHVTNESASQFSALYILVIAAAALLLPAGGGLLIAALGNVLYVADVVLYTDGSLGISVWLQLGVFAVVALGSALLSAQLQRANAGSDRLAAELEHQKLQADEILRNIRSGVLTLDREGQLLYANPTAERMLGRPLLARVGQPVLGDIAAVAPDLAAAFERALLEGPRTMRADAVVATGARRYPIGVTTTCVDRDGDESPAGRTVTAIFSDISDQKRMEALRLRAERLEGVAELSASLAHEIKNPLAAIRSAVEQLARRKDANDDERMLGALVLRESDRLSRLLSEFLDFARVRVTRTTPVDLAAIARNAASLVASHPEAREGVTVTCVAPTTADGGSLVVDGDEDLLHRAVFNLALNAVQASPATGEVRIEVTPGTFDPLPAGAPLHGGTVALRVTDEGSGIASEVRDRMFDPFFTTKPGGSGLGLAVVHRAIEAHRGLVFVDSSPRGTRFTVVLPRAARAVETPVGVPLIPSIPVPTGSAT